MTYNRPGQGTHVTNDTAGTLTHGQACVLQGHVGVISKQKEPSSAAGLAGRNLIAIGEKAWLVKKGIVQVTDPGGLANDGPVYIIAATNVLTATASGNVKFGRVVETTADNRGVPTGKIRIDLDAKDSF